MRNIFASFILLYLCLLCNFFGEIRAENVPGKYTISGYIKDADNGESLIGATVFVKELKVGTAANIYGFYSISLAPGKYTLEFSFLGFTKEVKQINLNNNITVSLELKSESQVMQEVTVTADRPEMNVKKAEMSVAKMEMKTIKKIPAFMGEVDLIKAIQLLPGVQSASEGTSAFNVRGGSSDQNLILLDEATVYNASHLMGFFSVFNNDAIKDIKLFKGDIPASNGGRLASLLDVRMKDGNSKKFSGSGGIGTISSRLTLEGPILKDRTSFIVSGRRTYADMFLPLASEEALRDNKLYFYDLNLKINHKINDNNRVFASGFFGRDVFKNDFAGMDFGNQTVTVRWNHLFSPKLFSNLTAVYSQYNYALTMENNETSSVTWKYNMKDLGLKGDFTYFPIPQITTKFGFETTKHYLDPGKIESDMKNFQTFKVPENYSLENAVYISNEQDITPKLSIKYGLRYSWFYNIGEGTVYQIDDNYDAVDSTVYAKGNFYHNYGAFEPRLGFKYEFSSNMSVKGSYSRTIQYMQMASNGSAGTPMDLWFTSSPNVKPQVADQYALGLFRNFFSNKIQTSVEVYYKDLDNVIDFKDHANLYLNKKLEAELRFGTGRAYGAEFLVQFPEGKLNGWVSYTYSKVERKIKEINDGKRYLAPYSKPHNVNIVLNYDASKRVSFGCVWVYSTGAPATFPSGRMVYGNHIFPVYTERNTFRIGDYHRLDVSLTLKGKEKPNRFWHGEWNFSVYNVYSRKNPWVTQFVQDKDNPDVTTAKKVYLFPVIPAVTYNFKF
jgi:outer membrane cobalamin receptor